MSGRRCACGEHRIGVAVLSVPAVDVDPSLGFVDLHSWSLCRGGVNPRAAHISCDWRVRRGESREPDHKIANDGTCGECGDPTCGGCEAQS